MNYESMTKRYVDEAKFNPFCRGMMVKPTDVNTQLHCTVVKSKQYHPLQKYEYTHNTHICEFPTTACMLTSNVCCALKLVSCCQQTATQPLWGYGKFIPLCLTERGEHCVKVSVSLALSLCTPTLLKKKSFATLLGSSFFLDLISKFVIAENCP